MMGSLFRDRISSGYQKISIVLSRFFSKKTHDSRDKALSDLLLDTEAVEAITKVANAYKDNKLSAEDFVKTLGILGLKTAKAGYIGLEAEESLEADTMAQLQQ